MDTFHHEASLRLCTPHGGAPAVALTPCGAAVQAFAFRRAVSRLAEMQSRRYSVLHNFCD
jgi:predicted ATPase